MKKAQIKMTETIAVLFVFLVLIVFGMIFYFQFQRSSLEQREAEIAGERAISTALQAAFLPELRCSKGENIPVRDCIDLYKLNFSKAKMEDEIDYYFDIFGYANISVKKLYPGPEEEWVLYDNPKPDFRRKARTPIPVSIFEPVKREFYFGVLNVEVYS